MRSVLKAPLSPKTRDFSPVADAPACVRRVRGEDGGVAIDVEGKWTWLHPARAEETAALQARLDAAYDPLRRRASLVQLGDGRSGSIDGDALVDEPGEGRFREEAQKVIFADISGTLERIGIEHTIL